MVEFVGRRRELRLLQEAWSGETSAFVPIYGRRRIGKSELILHFMDRCPGLYVVGKQAPGPLQLRELQREAAVLLDEPLLTGLPADDWQQTLEAVVARWRGPGKLVLALDEFQWMVEASPELPSVLQQLWDRHWRDDDRVVLILCGSYVGFMERAVMGRKSPLFGRRTAQIHLQPFGHIEAAAFHPNWSLQNIAKARFVCGGVPLYLRIFSPHRSIASNIRVNLLDEFAPMFREPDFLLREELRDVENYHAVLLAIASGHGRAKDIARRAGVPERSLHYYLQQLIQLGYVARRHPLTGGRAVQRNVRYALRDPLLRFWFRFVFPNLSFLRRAGARRTWDERVRPTLDAWWGLCYEELCREALAEIYAAQGVSAGFEVGEYWDRGVQIDLVGLREDDWTDLGECRWGRIRSPGALHAELESRVAKYPNRRGATLGRHLFVRRKPKGTLPGGRNTGWHDLEDLYGRQAPGRGGS